jgi:hypothetical protein
MGEGGRGDAERSSAGAVGRGCAQRVLGAQGG